MSFPIELFEVSWTKHSGNNLIVRPADLTLTDTLMKLFKTLFSFSSSGFSPCCCSSPKKKKKKNTVAYHGPRIRESVLKVPFVYFACAYHVFVFFWATDSELIWIDFKLIWANQLDDRRTFLSAAVPRSFACLSLCLKPGHTCLHACMSATLFSEQLILNWFELILNWFSVKRNVHLAFF